jgi:carboxymethylenebutenolidase
MFKYLLILLTLLIAFGTRVFFPLADVPKEREYLVCHPEYQADDMRQFAADPAFQALHLSPLPLAYTTKGAMVNFDTPDGQEGKGYLVKSTKRSSKWLFVFQEWWGLNEHIKKEADRLHAELGEEVNVLALDMYDGRSTTDPKEAAKFMQGVKEERLENIVKGARAMAGKKAMIAHIGWCFGGAWSLKAGLINQQQNVGIVMYYGMPVRDVEKLKTLNSNVLGLFATEKYISKEVIESFAASMKEAGKGLSYTIYDAVHGFANPSNPKFDSEKAAAAHEQARTYLRKRLQL